MKTALTAVGIANPPFKRPQLETADLLLASLALKPSEKRLLKSIYRASGIKERYSVLSDYSKNPGEFDFYPNDLNADFPTTAMRMKIYKDNALKLCLSAVQNCFLAHPSFNKNEITHVITVSCTGMYAPGLDIEIVQALKLKPSTQRTAINFMGCYGAFNGIKVANAICQSSPDAKVLLVCVEICTIHFQKNFTLPYIISNSIFSDGAAAVIIENETMNQKSLLLENFHCDLIPQTEAEMAWTIADSGFDIVLSSYVPDVIKTGIAQFTERLLSQSKISLKEIDSYAIHPGGIKILEACEAALNITKSDNHYSYSILQKYGNMSSVTILFVLKSILDDLKQSDHNKNIFSCAFGPGLTLESMLLKYQHLH